MVGDRGLCCLNRESNCHEASTNEDGSCQRRVYMYVEEVALVALVNNENDKHPLVPIVYIFKSVFPVWIPLSLIFQRQ